MSEDAPANATGWPAVSFETHRWRSDPEVLRYVSKRSRERVLATYEAAVPAMISGLTPAIPLELWQQAESVALGLARFDEAHAGTGLDLPALLLRSESAASSHIERLTSSVRNVALAEISDDVPQNARLIAGNVEAMRRALDAAGDYSIPTIVAIQEKLLEASEPELAGLRRDQVWIGGTSLSPHGALFVPPVAGRVPELLDDLVSYVRTSRAPAVVTCAVAHAQFETIHPFADGNGRTGRALMHVLLADAGVLTQTALPISAGILHNVDSYFAALDAYQEGEVVPIVTVVIDALESALATGQWLAGEITAVLAEWEGRMTSRGNARIHDLPRLLVRHPVVDGALVAEGLGVSRQTAHKVIEEAVRIGILSKRETRTKYRRTTAGRPPRPKPYYQADAIISLLEAVASNPLQIRSRSH